jgi:hypothetical protein
MKNVILLCGECSYEFGLGVDFDPAETTAEDPVEKLGGEEDVCPRCDSVIFLHFAEVALAEPERHRRAKLAHGMGQRIRGIRFAVGSGDGPRSAEWRLWLNERKDTVHIAAPHGAKTMRPSDRGGHRRLKEDEHTSSTRTGQSRPPTTVKLSLTWTGR